MISDSFLLVLSKSPILAQYSARWWMLYVNAILGTRPTLLLCVSTYNGVGKPTHEQALIQPLPFRVPHAYRICRRTTAVAPPRSVVVNIRCSGSFLFAFPPATYRAHATERSCSFNCASLRVSFTSRPVRPGAPGRWGDGRDRHHPRWNSLGEDRPLAATTRPPQHLGATLASAWAGQYRTGRPW